MTESRPIRILYMEDDPGLARLVQKKLERAGYVVDLSSDGEQGLAMYEAGFYDIVAIDQAMPVHDGLEVLRILASRGSLPPTIVVTGAGNERIAVEAMKLGARDYVVKDVDGGYLDLLPTVIERALQQQRLVEEKQRALKALQESEERFKILFEFAPDAYYLHDLKGTLIDGNRTAEELIGCKKGDMIGKNILDLKLLPPQQIPQAAAILAKNAQGQATGPDEFTLNRKDGTQVAVEITTFPVKIQGQAVVLGLARDVTERKRVEEERERLLAAEREQRLLAETLAEVTLALTSQLSHEAVLDEILHQAQRIVPHDTANIALLEDDTLRTVRWQGYEAFDGEETVSSLAQPLADLSVDAKVIQYRKPVVVPDTCEEPRWVRLDGTAWIRSYLAVPICLRDRALGLLRLDSATPGQFSAEDAERLQPLASAAAIAIENARLVGGLEAEVTARTAEIRAEQEKSNTILRSVGDAIAMTDLEMRIQYVNDAFTALTGYTPDEVMGQRMDLLLAETMPEQDRQALWLALDHGEVWQGEITVQRQDGRTYDAALTIAPMRDAEDDLVGYVSSHQDISRIKDLDRARSQFITNVSHQLRTPVTTIQLYAHMLRREPQPDQAKRYVELIDEETSWLIQLIEDILKMTALDSGKGVTTWEPIPLPGLIENLIVRYQDRAEASGLNLTAVPLLPNLPIVKGDQGQIVQALGEIIENAIAFTPSGGEVTVELRGVEDAGQPWITIAVRDTGPGIPPEEQAHVFDRFYRGSLAESGHTPGTGLGLSIAHEILRAHGGRVTVESTMGQGSAFTLWLRGSFDQI